MANFENSPEYTFKISGMMVFGPFEEKEATKGASLFLMDSLVDINAFAPLQEKNGVSNTDDICQ